MFIHAHIPLHTTGCKERGLVAAYTSALRCTADLMVSPWTLGRLFLGMSEREAMSRANNMPVAGLGGL